MALATMDIENWKLDVESGEGVRGAVIAEKLSERVPLRKKTVHKRR